MKTLSAIYLNFSQMLLEDRIYEEKQAAKAQRKLEKERAKKLKALRKLAKKAEKGDVEAVMLLEERKHDRQVKDLRYKLFGV